MIPSITLSEWETRRPEPGSALAGATLVGDPAAQELAQRLTRENKIEVLELASGLELRANSFVGSFLLGQFNVIIRPKIPGPSLLNLLRYAYGLRHLDLFGAVDHTISQCTFQDLLIHQLAIEVAELLSGSLHREYERRAESLPTPRGRIDFQSYASTSAHASSALPCIHHPRSEDILINQALLAGVLFAARLTDDIALRSRLRGLQRVLKLTVTERFLDIHLVMDARQAVDRRTVAYIPALTLIELLLSANGIALQEGHPAGRMSGFLFDMNRFFQALMSRFLRQNLPGYTIKAEPHLRGMFAYDPAKNPLCHRAPAQKPDFVLMKQTEIAAVLDAKYRDLWKTALPREMLYQLALYALGPAGKTRHSAILYPTVEDSAVEQVITIYDPNYGTPKAKVTLRPVNLLNLDRLLTTPATQACQRQQVQLAMSFAFGTPTSH